MRRRLRHRDTVQNIHSNTQTHDPHATGLTSLGKPMSMTRNNLFSISFQVRSKKVFRLFINIKKLRKSKEDVVQQKKWYLEVLVAEQHPWQEAASSQGQSWNPMKLDKD